MARFFYRYGRWRAFASSSYDRRGRLSYGMWDVRPDEWSAGRILRGGAFRGIGTFLGVGGSGVVALGEVNPPWAVGEAVLRTCSLLREKAPIRSLV